MEQLEGSESTLFVLFLTGKKTRIIAEEKSVESLHILGQKMKERNLQNFQKDCGDILDLLAIPIQVEALTTMA